MMGIASSMMPVEFLYPNLSAIAVSLAILLAVYKFLLYPAVFSPLSRIPAAHPTASVCPIWIHWKRFNGEENRTIHAAHQKYGPIVRLGPNELSVNMVDGGIRSIYAGGYEKGTWYDIFDNYGVPCMFSTADHKRHADRKRMISNIYSKSSIQNSQHMHDVSTAILHDRLFPLLVNNVGHMIEVHSLMNAVTMDMINAYIFGLRSGSNFIQDEDFRGRWLELYHSRRRYTFWSQELPNFTRFMRMIGLPVVPDWVDENTTKLEAWAMEMCDRAEASIDRKAAGERIEPADEPVVYEQLRTQLEKEFLKGPNGSVPPHSQLYDRKTLRASEVVDHLGAGHETSAICMTYILYYLSKHQHIQRRLRKELVTLSPALIFPPIDSKTLPSAKELDILPFLHAVVMETLRINPPIPGPQPRKTPPNASLGGYENIPAGVRVSALPYSLHKNAEVFPCPDEWRPERWLETKDQTEQQLDGLGAQERNRWWWAFGSGGRMCIGSHLAMYEIKLLSAAIYTNFVTTIVDDHGIEQEDSYTARPMAAQLTLRFRPCTNIDLS